MGLVLGLGLGTGFGGAPPFSPGNASPLPLAWSDSELSALLDGSAAPVTSNGASIHDWKDARGTTLYAQATSGKQPKLDTATLLNGHRSIAFTVAATSEIETTAIGVSGNVDWSFGSVFAFDSTNTYPISDGPFVVLGGPSSSLCFAGTNAGAGWSFSASAQVASSVPHPHDGADQDLFVHLGWIDHRASDNRTRVIIDGRIVVSAIQNFSVLKRIAIGDGTAFNLHANTHLWATVMHDVVSDTLRAQYEAYFAARFKLFTVFALGDSLTFGFPDGAPGNTDYLFYLVPTLRALGCSRYNFGVTGELTSQILARVTSVTNLASGVPSVTILQGGTNDVFSLGANGVPSDPTAAAVQATANLKACADAIHAAGGNNKVVVLQMPPVGPTASARPAGLDTFRNALSAALSTATWADGYVAIPAGLTDATNATNYQSDQIHMTTTGRSAWAAAMTSTVKSVVGLP
jgi:lysophospholipase L1-like esterase